jgi:hypothetical protein
MRTAFPKGPFESGSWESNTSRTKSDVQGQLNFPESASCALHAISLPDIDLFSSFLRYNHFHRSVRGSQSGFPLLTPTMQAGQGSDGGGGVQVYPACWGGVVYCFCNYVTC